jgi:EAL domain-containing protein (putative c-di-GMP-specific phosphodiesterase class I)
VLSEACRQTQQWNQHYGTALRVAVNLSARQFRNTNIVADIMRTLKDTGFNAENLEFEVTESTLMTDTDTAIKVMNQFREHGISIAIDDFGTGYSSLNYLKRFPIDTLKIDRSFVRDLPDDSDDATIVLAIISLAQALRLNVVAEGIETAEQYAFLKEHGCNEAQGYYLGRPVPRDEFERLLV